MKILLGTTLAALVLAGPAMASTLSQPAGQPQAGVQVSYEISTPFTYGNGNSEAAPTFNYQDSVPMSASVAGAHNGNLVVPDSTMALVNATGGGR
ncbi:MAG TPA: hypothetical protein VMF62_04015 [Acetobacteraceae bacterium]|jgi:hypothetical protein|nr:hypothetical protein [Acetobacteraceae bacterium]